MTFQHFFKGFIILFVACWAQTLSAAEGDSASDVLEAYVSAAVATVTTIYETKPDPLEQSSLINQAGLSDYWVNSRKTTIEAKGSGAAFVQLVGFRADSWALGEFKQAGDFGEIQVDFSRTKTFRSGNTSTSSYSLVYEMVRVEDSWFISSFRKIVKVDAEVEAWEEQVDDVEMPAKGDGPVEVVKAQLDLLEGLPLQALKSASEKSSHLWQITRDARRGQGRVIAMVAAMSSYTDGPIQWKITVLDQGADTATVKAEITSGKNLAFKALVFTVVKDNDKWLLSDAVATR